MTGDLLASDAQALVNAVNCVGVMGKGIALQFKRAYPAMFEDYRLACASRDVAPGRLHIWRDDTGSTPRYVVNLPTKRHWRSKSRLEDVVAGLEALRESVRRHEIRSIAIPPLGCGHGGLDWTEVQPRIVDAFRDMVDVDVLLYEPLPSRASSARSEIEPQRMAPHTQRCSD